MRIDRSLAMPSIDGTQAIGKTTVPDKAVTGNNTPEPATDRFILSEKADSLLNLRSISDLEKRQFKAIIGTASSQENLDPKAFLASLSKAELDLVRRVHCLADRIEVGNLSDEGARNLLVEPGAGEDLDNNGLIAIGKGNTIAFPPRNAPESFKKAWNDAVEEAGGMLDAPMHLPFMIGLANLHIAEDGTVTQIDPDDPQWRNPFADAGFDYGGKIDEVVAGLKYQNSIGLLPDEIFKRDMRFYGRVKEGMVHYRTPETTS